MPKRARAVDLDVFNLAMSLLALFLRRNVLFFIHKDRIGDVVGVFFDNALEPVAVQKLLIFHMQDYRRAEVLFLRLFDRVVARVAAPFKSILREWLAADNFDTIRYHKRRIKPDAELSDEVAVLRRIAAKARHKALRAAARDSA